MAVSMERDPLCAYCHALEHRTAGCPHGPGELDAGSIIDCLQDEIVTLRTSLRQEQERNLKLTAQRTTPTGPEAAAIDWDGPEIDPWSSDRSIQESTIRSFSSPGRDRDGPDADSYDAADIPSHAASETDIDAGDTASARAQLYRDMDAVRDHLGLLEARLVDIQGRIPDDGQSIVVLLADGLEHLVEAIDFAEDSITGPQECNDATRQQEVRDALAEAGHRTGDVRASMRTLQHVPGTDDQHLELVARLADGMERTLRAFTRARARYLQRTSR